MRSTSAAIALVFSLLIAAGPALAEPLTFRGLGAKSTKADVLRLFPSAEVENECGVGQALARSADGVTLCEALVVERITLDNGKFSGTFEFNPDGHLRYLSLMRFFGSGFNGTSADIGLARSAASSLSDLLSTKYGAAVKDPPEVWDKSSLLKLEWQPGRGDKWQSGGDRISLHAEATESIRNPGSYMVSIQLFYTFAREQDLNDL